MGKGKIMRKLTPDSLREIPEFKLENGIANSTGDNAGIGDDVMEEKEISSVYCCDLLSRAMGRAPAGSLGLPLWGILMQLPWPPLPMWPV